jgi:hypothetical protein
MRTSCTAGGRCGTACKAGCRWSRRTPGWPAAIAGARPLACGAAPLCAAGGLRALGTRRLAASLRAAHPWLRKPGLGGDCEPGALVGRLRGRSRRRPLAPCGSRPAGLGRACRKRARRAAAGGSRAGSTGVDARRGTSARPAGGPACCIPTVGIELIPAGRSIEPFLARAHLCRREASVGELSHQFLQHLFNFAHRWRSRSAPRAVHEGGLPDDGV